MLNKVLKEEILAKKGFSILNVVLLGVVAVCLAIFALLGLIKPDEAQATNHLVRFTEIMAGFNGNSKAQFIEMQMQTDDEHCWGPQNPPQPPCDDGGPVTAVGRVMLTFHDAAGNQTGRFVFPNNPPNIAPNRLVLIATQEFVNETGVTPDFILPTAEIIPNGGKVCFRDNPEAVVSFTVNLCLSYGGSNYTGDTEGGGSPNPATLSVLNSVSLKRVSGGFGTNNNADFALSTSPDPQSSGMTSPFIAFPSAPSVEQGRTLFLEETFNGNGRTCASCHRPDNDFGINIPTVSALFANNPSDPLFIADFNLNAITLTNTSTPSDLRGTITSSLGATFTVLAGTQDKYLIYGGSAALIGQAITDSQGNTGTINNFTAGNLDQMESGGPTGMLKTRTLFIASPASTSPPLFLEATHLLNANLTPPFGNAGNVADIVDFPTGAARQHFSRSLSRTAVSEGGTDLRLPTLAERQAMKAFMLSVFNPQSLDSGSASLEFFATTEAQKRGRLLFVGDSRCAACHFGNGLDGNGLSLDTDINVFGGDFGPSGFNPEPDPNVAYQVDTLWGIRKTGPYFHNNAVSDLRDAILFYCSSVFANSPIGTAAPGTVPLPSFCASSAKVDDLLAFLNALVDVPFDFTRVADLGSQFVSAGPTTPAETITITNSGTLDLEISDVDLNGDGASHFTITNLPPATPFGNGASRNILVAFDPSIEGLLTATLEITAMNSEGETWNVGVALRGTGAADIPEITLSPMALAFGDRAINSGQTVAQTLTITNDGTAALNFTNAITLTGADTSHFIIISDSGQPTLAPGGNRQVLIAFNPSTTGTKLANLTIQCNDGDEGIINVALSGTGLPPAIYLPIIAKG